MIADSQRIAPFEQELVTTSLALKTGDVNLKAAATFFDVIRIYDNTLFEVDLNQVIGPELDELVREGLIDIRPTRAISDLQADGASETEIDETSSAMLQLIFSPVGTGNALASRGANGYVRMEAALLTRSISERLFVPAAVGVLDTPATARRGAKSDNVVTATELVFRRLPVPDELTPWSDIMDFRRDGNTFRHAVALQNWIRSAKSERGLSFERVLQAEVMALEEQLQARNMKVAVARTRMVLPWLDVLHSGLKTLRTFKLSEPAEPFVNVAERRLQIGDAERSVRNHPLYMIAHARSKLLRGSAPD